MKQTEPEKLNVLALAYMGDAVWEQFVRERVISSLPNANHADYLHKKGIHYVNANSQARVIKQFMDDGILTALEADITKRARNHRTATKAKNADPVVYKWATGFEALLGFLYLSDDKERLNDLMNKSAEILEAKNAKEK